MVVDPLTRERFRAIPGELRHRDVAVGAHVPIGPPAVPRFLSRFEDVYSRLGKTETILATAAAHHRLAWSIARGLARKVDQYKGHLAACDQTKRNDLDGRGNLSEENLAEFTRFFLMTCIDQVTFMEGLVQPDQLRVRILLWAEEEVRFDRLPPKSAAILEAVLYRDELPRGDAAAIIGTGDRQARRVVASLLELGVLASESSRAPLRLTFPPPSHLAGCQVCSQINHKSSAISPPRV